MKHLFTFRIADVDAEGTTTKRNGSTAMESEFSGDEQSQSQYLTYAESMIEGDKLTEYDATEKLLNLSPQLSLLMGRREGNGTIISREKSSTHNILTNTAG